MEKLKINTKQINALKFIILFLLILLPWSLNFENKENRKNLVEVTKENVGYYQTNTCSFSLFEFIHDNFNNKTIDYQFDNYSNIRCFNKVNGVDIKEDKIVVSIGVNLFINLILQSAFWITVLTFIPKNKLGYFRFEWITSFIISLLFLLHFFGEKRFYEVLNRGFNTKLEFNNFYIFNVFLVMFLITFITSKVLTNRIKYLWIIIPSIFLIQSTFVNLNLNLFLVIFSILGIQLVINKKFYLKILLTYLVLNFFWLENKSVQIKTFDVDKLRGFSISEINLFSQLFWNTIFLLIIFGVIYIVKFSEIDFKKLSKSLLIFGSIVFISGILSTFNSFSNFIIFYYLGLNKSPMKSITSIDGNTWRGIAPSAESIGEFYAVTIFLSICYILIENKKVELPFLTLFIINLFGLIRANNASSIITLIFILFLYFLKIKNILNFKKILFIGFLMFGLVLSINFVEKTYAYSSKILIVEGLRNSNLFENEKDLYLNVNRYFLEENDLKTIFLYPGNSEKISNSLETVINIYDRDTNIRYLPNQIAVISVFSNLINRSEKWGIFLSKYNPNLEEFILGYGPLNLVNYFNSHQYNNVEGLVLPHSSFLDILIFYGAVGLLFTISFLIFLLIKSSKNINTYWLVVLFYSINFIKSDSILYLSSFVIFLFFLLLLQNQGEQYVKKN